MQDGGVHGGLFEHVTASVTDFAKPMIIKDEVAKRLIGKIGVYGRGNDETDGARRRGEFLKPKLYEKRKNVASLVEASKMPFIKYFRNRSRNFAFNLNRKPHNGSHGQCLGHRQ